MPAHASANAADIPANLAADLCPDERLATGVNTVFADTDRGLCFGSDISFTLGINANRPVVN